MKKTKRFLIIIFLFLTVTIISRIIINSQYIEHPTTQKTEKEYVVYYLLNIDGMKGLGHSALMLVDENGAGLFYSMVE